MLTALIIVSVVAYACIGYTVQSLLNYLYLLEDAAEKWVVGILWPMVVFLALCLLVYLAVENCWKRFRQFRDKRKRQKGGTQP